MSLTRVMSPDDLPYDAGQIEDIYEPEALDGKLSSSPDDDFDKLAHTLLQEESESKADGELINEALDQGMQGFVPDMFFQNLVKNFQNAKRIYGERLLRRVTGFDGDYLERNINIPEFARELQGRITSKARDLEDKGLIDKQGRFADEALRLASLVMYMQELDNIEAKGMLGEHEHKERSHYGASEDVRGYRHGDRYRDIALKQTVKLALRRGHASMNRDDLRINERESKGTITVVYAIDASGSMKGDKIAMAKRAGVALAFKATEDRNKAGLLVFSSQVDKEVEPTRDFWSLLDDITRISAFQETNVGQAITQAARLLENHSGTRHLIFLTDAAPTVGDDPKQEALQAASEAVAAGITISVIALQVDEQGESFGRRLAEVGSGNFYMINELEELDTTVLEDYSRAKSDG